MLQEFEAAVYESMKAITAYCGEEFEAADPSRILRVVRDFVKLFEKALADIKVTHKFCDYQHVITKIL